MKAGSHANYLIYDIKENTVERFEPHGSSTPPGLNYEPTILDELIESRFKIIDDKIKYRLFGREIKVYIQGFRLYYAFRNTIYIYLKYRKFKQLISAFFYGLEVISCIIFYEGLKGLSKIKAIQRGIVDGLRGRLGKIDS